jgi:hypothetical protein
MFKQKKIQFIICFLIIFVSIIFSSKSYLAVNFNQLESNNNWNTITSNSVSMSLPKKYIGGDPAQDLDELIIRLEQINHGLANRLQPIRQQDLKSINFLAFNTDIDNSNLIDNVNIVSQKNRDGLSLDEYFQQQYKTGIFPDSHIDKQETINLKNNQIAKKIITNFSVEQTTIKQLFYVFEKADNFWTVTYTTSLDKFEQLLPMFEESLMSLNILN